MGQREGFSQSDLRKINLRYCSADYGNGGNQPQPNFIEYPQYPDYGLGPQLGPGPGFQGPHPFPPPPASGPYPYPPPPNAFPPPGAFPPPPPNNGFGGGPFRPFRPGRPFRPNNRPGLLG